MPTCHDVKVNETYECPRCGLALKVTKPCKNHGKPVEDCDTCDGQYQFTISCCGNHLVKK